LFSWSQAASANRKAVFFGRALGDVFATSGCVDVGEKEGGRLRRTELAERGKRNDQAMISGVI
jgi:hypothetical protein